MATYKYWNGKEWTTVKEIKEAYKALQKRFNKNLKNECEKDMDGEQIRINTGNDEYSYAQIEIIKGDFTIKKL